MASTIRSIRGRGKLSLGHARLMSVKLMQSRHLSFAFFDEYDVGQPFRVLHFSDRPCLEEFADLLINRFFCLSGAKLLLFCLTDLKDGLTVSPVSDYCGVNPSHVFLLPREGILVLFQEVNKEGV